MTPEAYKVMSMESKTILLKILCNVYEGRTDPDEWHEALAKCLHKKGDTSDPNNWRAICLKDMSARLMSGIMNARLSQAIQEHGAKTQFGSQPGLRSLDRLYTLRSALTTRRYHNQPTWALFIDLVNAFDTVNHELLFKLLERYRVQKDVASVVRKMYEGMFVKLKVGKEERCIPYTVGVQQGDNMTPLLFLFPMQAFREILEKKWIDEWGIESPEYKYFQRKKQREGDYLAKLRNQLVHPSTCSTNSTWTMDASYSQTKRT